MRNDLLARLAERPDLQYLLFRRGWVISKCSVEHPLLAEWKRTTAAGWHFMWHTDARCTIFESAGRTYFLMGHCYNPFTMQPDEKEALSYISGGGENAEEHQKRIDELTGVFVLGWIEGDSLKFLTDPSGMQSAYCGKVEENFIIVSHPQLIADVYRLEMDALVRKIISYKLYSRVKGCYLPGDLSPYKALKRVVPNIQYNYERGEVSHIRFYPLKPLSFFCNGREYDKGIREAAEILKNNIALTLQKWKKPAISLTGGIDSNTTFAAANGHYSAFETFSYLSAPKEVPDVEAAEKIAKRFNTIHTLFRVPNDSSEITDFKIKADILRHNSGYIAERKENELRKRIYLERVSPYDVEIKSWVSEAIRAYWYKHFNRHKMPKLSAKLYRNLYKIFVEKRSLAHEIDSVYSRYLKDYEYEKIAIGYDASDVNYIEIAMGSWGSLNISEMQLCFDITSIYNNRIFLDTMFRVPLEDRIVDKHHMDMKKYLNQELYDMNIRVVNMEETDRRAQMLNVIFTANMWLPF